MNISGKLAFWYENVRRDLPWRNSSDPYKIWISEIILQQTRVNQGIDYYERFILSYPDIFTLANAERDSVLKIWQGLGYYSRANNLHETSKYIAGNLNGRFPSLYKDLLELKGIGPYTAAAIASIVYNQPVAAIDGNVKRVISRLFLISSDLNSRVGIQQIEELANSILDRINPGRHNQAIMELGATICLPRNPKCLECPLNSLCPAFKVNRVHEFPEKYQKKTAKERFFIYLIPLSENKKILIRKRNEADIWKGLYEFPLIETSGRRSPEEMAEIICKNYNIHPGDLEITKISSEIIHKLSHQRIVTRFVHTRIHNKNIFQLDDSHWIKISEFSAFAISRLIDRYISKEGF
jgi:A/G-specific adenine glycosylase